MKNPLIKKDVQLNKLARCKLAPRYIASIRPTDISKLRDEWLNEKDEEGRLLHGPSTVRRDLTLLGHIFSTIIKDWSIPLQNNPVQMIRKPKESPARERRLQDDEETRLLKSCEMNADDPGGAHSRAPWLRPLVIFAIETAMRRSELVKLEWKDVDLKKRVAPKNGDDRAVSLSRRAMKRAKIDGLHFHDLRHEATSRLFEKDLNPMEVASITGHKSLAMLQRYTHLKAEDLARKLG